VIQKIGDSYFVTWPGAITGEFHHLREHSDGIAAELSLTQNGLVAYWGRLTLASAVARTTAAKAAGEAIPGQAWLRIINESCLQVVALHRKGAPTTALEPRPPSAARWLVEGLVPQGETTILFGDGGSGKSLFALGFAVSGLTAAPLGRWRVAPVRTVLYLDWESSRSDHEERLWGLLGPEPGVAPGAILYRPMTRPVAEEAGELRTVVAQAGVDLVICDSLGPACGAEPETAGAATAALNALRSLAPATRLVIAHVSKMEADRQRGHSRPFGSVYVYNLARSVIEAKRNEGTEPDEFTLTLTHTKSNTGPRKGQAATRFLFSPEGYIFVRPGDPDLARAPLSAQIRAHLRDGAKTAQELAELCEAADNHIRARLSQMEKAHTVVRLTALPGGRGNKGLWGLAEKPHTS